MCRLDRVTSYVSCDISDLRAGMVSTGAGKSRQGLPQPSSRRRMARQYLGVPATSATVERLFSVVGFAFADRRKRASTETLWPTSPSLSSKLNLPTAKLQ